MKLIALLCLLACLALADSPPAPAGQPGRYVLGPDDTITVHVPDIDEFNAAGTTGVKIDPAGDVRLPLLGKIHAGGLTVDRLEEQVAAGLSRIMNHPDVTITVTAVASRPVSVLGSVRNPGVYQLSGRKDLLEVLSQAGGTDAAAGNTIKITRRLDEGPLPLPGAKRDPGGDYYIAEVNINAVMQARDPKVNIEVLPNDVITVPKADLIYVIGAVKRPGGFPLNQEKQMSVLQALSLAEGLDKVAKAGGARILRPSPGNNARVEIPVDVAKILNGSARDVTLNPDDILFVPDSQARSASVRALEAAVQMAVGVAIWRL